MDLLARVFSGDGLWATGAPGPLSDYWYSPYANGAITESGIRVDPNAAQNLSAWYRGRDILATVVAMLPLPVYRVLASEGGSEPAKDHPLYGVLHDAPNDWQDSFQWRRDKMYHLIDYGWSYDWIVPGPQSFADYLKPIHPTRVTPKQITKGPNAGRYIFHVRDEDTGQTTSHTQDEIFYLRGAGGKGILDYARASLGTALATESYAAQIFGKGTLNGGTLEVPAALDTEAGRRMALSFLTKPGEHHLPKVLEQGAKFVPNNMTPENAQMLLSRRHSVDDIARWLNVPRSMLENSDPAHGNMEQFDENFLAYGMGPWLSLFESGINHQLMLTKRFYAEFTRDAIVRSKFLDRAQGNVALVNAGIVTVDEVRAKEGKNTRGGKADELRDPQNITGKPQTNLETNPGTPKPAPKKPAPSQASAIAVSAAARLLRKEVAAVQKAAVKHAADGDAFAVWVAEFYADHRALVADTLHLSEAAAESYCVNQARQIMDGAWVVALTVWQEQGYAEGLAALALEEAA